MKPARDPRYLAWVRSLPCWICRRQPCDPHHALPSVTSQKASDYCCMPLCRAHHEMSVNRKEFARRFNLDIPAIIRALNARYLEYQIERGQPRQMRLNEPLPWCMIPKADTAGGVWQANT